MRGHPAECRKEGEGARAAPPLSTANERSGGTTQVLQAAGRYRGVAVFQIVTPVTAATVLAMKSSQNWLLLLYALPARKGACFRQRSEATPRSAAL
jgi:hypothetical protein